MSSRKRPVRMRIPNREADLSRSRRGLIAQDAARTGCPLDQQCGSLARRRCARPPRSHHPGCPGARISRRSASVNPASVKRSLGCRPGSAPSGARFQRATGSGKWDFWRRPTTTRVMARKRAPAGRAGVSRAPGARCGSSAPGRPRRGRQPGPVARCPARMRSGVGHNTWRPRPTPRVRPGCGR
jgi:hypothetical protein